MASLGTSLKQMSSLLRRRLARLRIKDSPIPSRKSDNARNKLNSSLVVKPFRRRRPRSRIPLRSNKLMKRSLKKKSKPS